MPLPALHMMESIRRKLMKRAHKRLENARKWSGLTPQAICKNLVQRQDEGSFMTVLCSSETVFEVKSGTKFYIFNLNTHGCDCDLWKMSGIPCKHAMVLSLQND
ncbi:hypothetical protein ACOSQ4_005153 [Xanthoceras sorbifolium]